MVERESKPGEAPPPVSPHQNMESGVFLKAVIPDPGTNPSLPFSVGSSNQSGILPGHGGPLPPSTPPVVQPPSLEGGSSGSTIYHLEPPPPAPPSLSFPEPEDSSPLPRGESPARRTTATPVPPSRILASRPPASASPPLRSRAPDLDHDYSKPLLIAYSIAATIIILILLIRNAIIGLIAGS